MKVEVVTPEDYMGDIIGDLNSRRGQHHRYGPAGQRPGDRGQWCPFGGDVRIRQHPAVR